MLESEVSLRLARDLTIFPGPPSGVFLWINHLFTTEIPLLRFILILLKIKSLVFVVQSYFSSCFFFYQGKTRLPGWPWCLYHRSWQQSATVVASTRPKEALEKR